MDAGPPQACAGHLSGGGSPASPTCLLSIQRIFFRLTDTLSSPGQDGWALGSRWDGGAAALLGETPPRAGPPRVLGGRGGRRGGSVAWPRVSRSGPELGFLCVVGLQSQGRIGKQRLFPHWPCRLGPQGVAPTASLPALESPRFSWPPLDRKGLRKDHRECVGVGGNGAWVSRWFAPK